MAKFHQICHITVLNPISHPRVYAKIAQTQSEMGFSIAIIGQKTDHTPPPTKGFSFFDLPKIHRLSWKRFSVVPFLILKYTTRTQADIFWIHTPELFWIGLYWKIRGKKIVYDVHEDYYKTILYAKHYHYWLRKPIALFWRTLERMWVKYVDAVVYAELCYDDILSAGDKKYVLRNKFNPTGLIPSNNIQIPATPYMLYTGTIAPEWGIWRAIELWESINIIQPMYLIVAGFTHSLSLIEDIEQRISQSKISDYFTLLGGNKFVPYGNIIHLIRHCYMGVALYKITPTIQGKIPTKFYEYMAFNKPLVFTDDPEWIAFHKVYQLGIPYPMAESAEGILKKLKTWEYQHKPSDYDWESEKPIMKRLLTNLMSK